MSLCQDLGARRLRPGGLKHGIIWREPKAFPVPKVAAQHLGDVKNGIFTGTKGRQLL